MKIWRLALAMLAAFSLASCNDDDDETISVAEINRALQEMKKDYVGELRYGMKDEGTRLTLKNVVVHSADELLINIPLDPIADQVEDAAIAQQLREWKTVQVRATYKFKRVEQEYFSFNLKTEMVPDERFAQPITRTSPVLYKGLQLMFNQDYTGEYQKATQALTFNICVGNVQINQVPLNDFKPVIYTYGGNAQTTAETNQEKE